MFPCFPHSTQTASSHLLTTVRHSTTLHFSVFSSLTIVCRLPVAGTLSYFKHHFLIDTHTQTGTLLLYLFEAY